MPVIIENAPVMFQCNKCAWFGRSLPELIDHHDATHELLVSRQPMHAAPVANKKTPARPRFCNECGGNWPDAPDDATCPYCGSGQTVLHSDDDAPAVALDLTHRPARPVVSRAKRRSAVEIELAASEAVGQAGRRVTR